KSINNNLETQGWKIQKSCRESYGDNAVGYVQVERKGKIVDIIGKMTPEHKLSSTPYAVKAQVDERVCKHAVAFAMWLHRRTEEPSPTSTVCYWKRSILSTVKDQGTFVTVFQMKGPKKPLRLKDDLSKNVLSAFLKEEPSHCQLYLHFCDVDKKRGSIHSLIYKFYHTSSVKSAQNFLKYAEDNLRGDLINEIEAGTKGQSKSTYWYELRYGRVTASKIHELCNCRTSDGSLVAAILGSSKFEGNWATRRGLELKDKVIYQLESETKQKFRKSSFLINESYPFFGASPDAVSDTHVIEIKCPSKTSTVSMYVSENGSVNPKFYAQLQTQMLLAGKMKGFFCVADPAFESNEKISFYEFTFDKKFCTNALKNAKAF
ncbi:hypothetical protein Bhyg_07274, partial [Pseudolycoriella hygida]